MVSIYQVLIMADQNSAPRKSAHRSHSSRPSRASRPHRARSGPAASKTNERCMRSDRRHNDAHENQSMATIRINQVAGLLGDLLAWQHPADAVLSRWMRANRNAGSRDRAQVADAAFTVMRHLRRYRHVAESVTGPQNRRLAILGLA